MLLRLLAQAERERRLFGVSVLSCVAVAPPT